MTKRRELYVAVLAVRREREFRGRDLEGERRRERGRKGRRERGRKRRRGKLRDGRNFSETASYSTATLESLLPHPLKHLPRSVILPEL